MSKSKKMIQEALEKENRAFFFPRSIHLDFLKNCPQVIPTLAQWLYDEWRSYDASLTKEKLIDSFKTRLSCHAIPIAFVALKNSQPIGVVSLKRETDPEFSDFPDSSIWMGSLQVAPEERNLGLGQQLVTFAQKVAQLLGHDNLYLYTSNPTNVRWYLKRGAKRIEERPFRNHTITIMAIPL